MALLITPTITTAATINLSSLETVLDNPDPNTNPNIMQAACIGWLGEMYEHNMPFIELANGIADQAISVFKMTIGDTRYHFANEFLNKQFTNSWMSPPNGEYALLGDTTPGINFTTSVEDNGDTLVVDFGPNGLQPGQTVRFQVDINKDVGSQGTMTFASYSQVFFEANGGPDISGNSVLSILEEGSSQFLSLTLPNFDSVNPNTAMNPRDHSQMQGIDYGRPDTPFNPIPEPNGLLLASLAASMLLARSRRKAS